MIIVILTKICSEHILMIHDPTNDGTRVLTERKRVISTLFALKFRKECSMRVCLLGMTLVLKFTFGELDLDLHTCCMPLSL